MTTTELLRILFWIRIVAVLGIMMAALAAIFLSRWFWITYVTFLGALTCAVWATARVQRQQNQQVADEIQQWIDDLKREE